MSCRTYLAEIAVEDGGANRDGGDALDGVGRGRVGRIVDVDLAIPARGGQVAGHGRPPQRRDGVFGPFGKLDVPILLGRSREGSLFPLVHLDAVEVTDATWVLGEKEKPP